jgi:hypothetical protein
MHFLATLTAAGSVSTVLTTLVGLQFTPARYWSWRFRRYMQTVKEVDAVRQPNQYAVLMPRANYLSSKVAAAYRIPTDWGRFGHAAVMFGFFVGFILTSIIQAIFFRGSPSVWSSPVGAVIAVFAVVLWSLDARILIHSFYLTRNARARFIKQGCPPNFPVPERYWAMRRRIARADLNPNDPHRLALRRSRVLRDTGMIPREWRPRSFAAIIRRELADWRRNRDLVYGRVTADVYRLPAARSHPTQRC